jgi:hypothetical protein
MYPAARFPIVFAATMKSLAALSALRQGNESGFPIGVLSDF